MNVLNWYKIKEYLLNNIYKSKIKTVNSSFVKNK